MKSLLSYLLLLSTIGYSQCSIYEDQTNNANNKAVENGEGPMHFACRLGYNLRPGIKNSDGQWVRDGGSTGKVVDQIRKVTFPVDSQQKFPKLQYITPLQNIACDAYVGDSADGIPWDSAGVDVNCPRHNYVYGT